MIKVLYVATSDTHLATFHVPYIRWLKEHGCRVDIAVEKRGSFTFDDVTATFNLPFPRSISPRQLLRTYRKLKEIIDDGSYDLIHCHTPIPSMLARLAAISSRRRGSKVLYTAHGFHFFRGAGVLPWLLYFPVEFVLSMVTDGIVTINDEDFRRAHRRLLCSKVFHIKGIGVDSKRFKPCDLATRKERRTQFGFDPDAFILLYIAEFIPRKNHAFIIRALPYLQSKIPNLKVLFAGTGILHGTTQQLAHSSHLDDVVMFLGFRNDVDLLAAIADVGISSSKQEGLGLGLVEQMMCGVPAVASDDRGHREFVEDGVNGYLYTHGDIDAFVGHIIQLYHDAPLRNSMGLRAYETTQSFDVEISLQSMASIYTNFLPL